MKTRAMQCISLGALVAGCATPPPFPPYVAQALAHQNIHAVASIRYEDVSGHLVDEQEFDRQFAQTRSLRIIKTREDGLPDVTVRLHAKSDPGFPALTVGEAMPAFHLKRLDGSAIDNEALQGRYTLVTFYGGASEMSALKALPMLNAVAKHRKDVNVLAFTRENDVQTAAFVDRQGFDWPIVTSADGLFQQIGVDISPSTALFDPDGKLVEVIRSVGWFEDPARFDAWLDQRTGRNKNTPVAAIADLRNCAMPVYPVEELRARHTGTVKVNFLISTDGIIKKAEMTTSSGFPGLDQAAMVALMRCRFKPATVNGMPVERWAPVEYRWTLN